jgi:hypothetical protein
LNVYKKRNNMPAKLDAKELAKQIEKAAKKEKLLISIIKSAMSRGKVVKFADELAKMLEAKVVRTGYTPNSDISLFEMRRKGLALVMLVLRSDEEKIVAVEPTTDIEVAEIESNIYSSNINDVYVRLVSDIF